MLTLSNLLSFCRVPLALLYLVENTTIRVVAIVAAMITDGFDGYFARKAKSTSRFGAILDPAMDKFFVYFILMILLSEAKIELWQSSAMISRDFALWIFAFYLVITGSWRTWEVKSIRWGKITTAAQFLVLLLLTLNVPFPSYCYFLFIALGGLSLVELFIGRPR